LGRAYLTHIKIELDQVNPLDFRSSHYQYFYFFLFKILDFLKLWSTDLKIINKKIFKHVNLAKIFKVYKL